MNSKLRCALPVCRGMNFTLRNSAVQVRLSITHWGVQAAHFLGEIIADAPIRLPKEVLRPEHVFKPMINNPVPEDLPLYRAQMQPLN